MRHLRRLLVAPACALAVFGAVATARAHEVNFSRGDYRPSPGGAEAWITFARPDLLNVLPALDIDGDGSLSDAEIGGTAEIYERILQLVKAQRGSVECKGTVTEVSPTERDGGMFVVRFGPCAGDAPNLTIHIGELLKAVSSGHRHTAFVHVAGESKPRDAILHGAQAVVEVPVGTGDGAAAPASGVPSPGAPKGTSPAASAFALGIRRFFSLEPLLFVAALLAVHDRLRSLVASVAAFAAAHSATLALMLMGAVVPRAPVVGALVALSLVYVGGDNLLQVDAQKRWRIAGAFGLMHGFGLAVAAGSALPRERLGIALASYIAGVELALVAFTGALIVAHRFAAKNPSLKGRAVSFASAVIAIVGLVRFAIRVL